MEVITRDTEEVRAYFEALEEGMRYLDTVTAHFRPAMNGDRLIPYISLPGKTLYRQSDLLRMLEENYVDMRPKRKRGKSPT
ncbi:DNA-binding protein [Phocaeicola coprocola]|uniref:DNA-binding protein n=1 Tax=Phocaeicola coprocola TaxID=310298 RepID=UPI0022E29F9A|nr:DNA-binding protein [Phocaeicola coprocola]